MIKFVCSLCKSDIRNFQVLVKDFCYATDYVIKEWKNYIHSTGEKICRQIVHEDRQYLDGYVKEVLFQCPKCGVIKINKRDCPNLNHFIRDTLPNGNIDEEDIKADRYGSILVEKINDN